MLKLHLNVNVRLMSAYDLRQIAIVCSPSYDIWMKCTVWLLPWEKMPKLMQHSTIFRGKYCGVKILCKGKNVETHFKVQITDSRGLSLQNNEAQGVLPYRRISNFLVKWSESLRATSKPGQDMQGPAYAVLSCSSYFILSIGQNNRCSCHFIHIWAAQVR